MQISACVQLEIKVILCLDPDLQEFGKKNSIQKRSISVLNLFKKMDRRGEKLSWLYTFTVSFPHYQQSQFFDLKSLQSLQG